MQSREFSRLTSELAKVPESSAKLDSAKVYSLAELIDFAEQNNPETRLAWERAKARAAVVGVARGALYPTIAAVTAASSIREHIFFGTVYVRQTVETFEPALSLYYTVFDFGARGADIDIAKANLLAADLGFNDTHRKIIFAVTTTYFRLLNAIGQEDAAQANLVNAQTSQQSVEARLHAGLATLPDVLQARAATAQAQYELASIRGAEEIARGELASSLGVSPATEFKVQDLSHLTIPSALTESVEQMTERALVQRPDFMQRAAELRAAQSEVNRSRSAFFPSLEFRGLGGIQRRVGEQDLEPSLYGGGETWNAQFTLKWTLFDGAAREQRLSAARSQVRAAQADIAATRDEVAIEVWRAYTNARTSLEQRQAAAALLEASDASYIAALESYRYGVRTFLDVVSAQRTLAQARTADVRARMQVLTNFADLAHRTGDLLQERSTRHVP